jgi:anti-sigma regulatory factor (Ser/Thr protein kinase)
MADQLTLQIKNSLPEVQAANETVSRWLADWAAPAEIEYFANLAIEEFATNTIKYGYDDENEHWIEVSLSLSGGKLVLTIIDDGRAFNPMEAPEPNMSVPVEDRPVGGLGIYLVRKMSDRMDYSREDNRNKLWLQKALRGSKEAQATADDGAGS